MTAISRRRPDAPATTPLLELLSVAFARHVGRHTPRAIARREALEPVRLIRIRRKTRCAGPCPCHADVLDTATRPMPVEDRLYATTGSAA